MIEGLLAIYYLTLPGGGTQEERSMPCDEQTLENGIAPWGGRLLEEDTAPWDSRPLEERETEELVSFVRQALQELARRSCPLAAVGVKSIRITRGLRIFIGPNELKIRPMSKTVLLLFLKHPEGIALKRIGDYRGEMERYYRRLSRSSDPAAVQERVLRILDIFNNDLNVNISRINAAVAQLVKDPSQILYRIGGAAGTPKSILLDRSLVIWE